MNKISTRKKEWVLAIIQKRNVQLGKPTVNRKSDKTN